MPPTPQQQRTRARFETLIGLASPLFDLVLVTGERVSRIVGGDDDYIPIRSSADRFELPRTRPRAGND
jgi:hypothetical protein